MFAVLRSSQRALQCAAPKTHVAKFSATAAEPLVLVEKINNYAVVRMNRPPVNSLNTAVRAKRVACWNNCARGVLVCAFSDIVRSCVCV